MIAGDRVERCLERVSSECLERLIAWYRARLLCWLRPRRRTEEGLCGGGSSRPREDVGSPRVCSGGNEHRGKDRGQRKDARICEVAVVTSRISSQIGSLQALQIAPATTISDSTGTHSLTARVLSQVWPSSQIKNGTGNSSVERLDVFSKTKI